MLTLGIDTSGKTASCAVCSENEVLAQYSAVTQNTQSKILMPLMKRMLEDMNITLNDIGLFAAVNGPGSYTGLRIGISAVKGICFALEKKCTGVSALNALAHNFCGTDSRICAVMHARQDLAYAAFFDVHTRGGVDRLTEDRIIPADELCPQLKEYAKEKKIICAGDWAEEIVRLSADENITAAYAPMNMPLASSVCFAAMKQEIYEPEHLNAEYMQITKAEKDLEEKTVKE